MRTPLQGSCQPRRVAFAAVALVVGLTSCSPPSATSDTASASGDAADTSTDAAVDVATDVGVGCPGAGGCACVAATDCSSAICVETRQGGRCADYCGDGDCPQGWSCQGRTGGGDGTYFCIPKAGLLCRPCENHEVCRAAGYGAAACVDYGDVGAFCGVPCQSDAGCSNGSVCRDVKGIDGGPVRQCVQGGAGAMGLGVCACPPTSVTSAHGTLCWLVDGQGAQLRRCKGRRACGPEGLGACTALTGAEAQCFDQQCLDALTGLPVANGKACDDGRPCTAGDVCKAGACQSGTPVCPCEPGVLECPAPGGVDASNQCRGALYCAATAAAAPLPFQCLPNPGQTKVCDASLDSPCTKNACVPLSGACTPTAVERTVEFCDQPNGADGKPGCRREVKANDVADGEPVACDDGVACSVGDACMGGACAGDAAGCDCTADKDCVDDGDLCNGLPYCDKSDAVWKCAINPFTAVSCDQSGDSGCLQTACVPATGACKKDFAPSKTPCSDGLPCTVGDVCDNAGKCQPGTWTCCKSDADCGKEEDGDACNGTLFCDKAAGACKLNPATVVTCPTVDDSTCSKAACNKATGTCGPAAVIGVVSCDDSDPCTDGDACSGGACVGGTDTCACATDADCGSQDDGDLCNGTFYCNKVIGRCKHNPATVVVCQTVDDVACKRNQCQVKTGVCAPVALPAATTCDADGTGCTHSDACDGAGACVPGVTLGIHHS